MGRPRTIIKHHCLTCQFEPNWKSNIFDTNYGMCRCPVTKKQYRPLPMVMLILVQSWSSKNGNYVYAHTEKQIEIVECPTWKQKEIKKEEENERDS